MGWKVHDFECPNCGTRRNDVLTRDGEDEQCDECGVVMVKVIGTNADPVTIVRGNADFAQRERARLQKRADEHWNKKGKDDAVDRERALMKRQGLT